MALASIYSTVAASAIARAAEDAYAVGRVVGCRLLNRGFNDVYELDCEGSSRIARLSAHRARGPANIAYETAFLAHLSRCGIAVGAPLAARDGKLWTELEAPEGLRTFAIFERVTGEQPLHAFTQRGRLKRRTLDDLRLLGEGNAKLHAAGESYRGPASLYRLEREHLLSRPLDWITSASAIGDRVRNDYAELGLGLSARLSAFESDLSTVRCHGDNHGGNTFVSDRPGGERFVSWFDFDDCGPGYQAYDLSVLLWNLLHRTSGSNLDTRCASAWAAFIEGYREVRAIPDVDFTAIALCVSLRHIWFVGEYASRLPLWGTEALPRGWFQSQLARIRGWSDLVTPVAV